MLLTEYLAWLAAGISEYSKTGLILSSELTVDARTDKIGLIKGTAVFLNNSTVLYRIS